jgi:glycosyltransferase involved in cell wall biosynthesis
VVLAKAHPQNTYAARKTQRIVVLDADDDEVQGSRLTAPERLLMHVVERSAAKRARLITTCSPALTHRYRSLPGSAVVECIPTSIQNTKGSDAPDIRAILSIPQTAQIVMYIGSVAIQSGHRVDHVLDVWDEVAEHLPDAHLVIAGDGIDLERIKLKAAHHPRIHSMGRFPSSHAIPFTRQATVLIDPADRSPQAEAKSSSRVLYALVTGTPIVAAQGGIREIILPRSLHSRFLYNPDDLSTLTDSIQKAVLPETADMFRQETSGLWEQWSWDAIGKRFCSLLEHTI